MPRIWRRSAVVALLAIAATAFAASPASAGRGSAALSAIQQRARIAIELREATIRNLESLVAANGTFVGEDRSELTSRLQAAAAALNALGRAIASGSRVSTAFTDYLTIFDNYRIYVLVDPVTRFVRASDALDTLVEPGLRSAQQVLGSLVARERQMGRDVSGAVPPMRDLRSQISRIGSVTDGLSARLLAMTPTAWNENPALLAPALSSLGAARDATLRAVGDIHDVEQVLQ